MWLFILFLIFILYNFTKKKCPICKKQYTIKYWNKTLETYNNECSYCKYKENNFE